MIAAALEQREEPGYARAFALAFATHLILLAVLFLGVRWQSHAPDAVVVELWDAPVPQEAPRAEPPKPAPRVEPPPPPKAAAKPEPRIEKPDIKLKAEKAPPKPKPEAKVPPPKPAPKNDPMQKLMREQLAREQASLQAQQQEQAMRDLLARDAAAARAKATDAWVGKIRAKIRGNIVEPIGIQGNPEAIFDVVQLPTGEVLSVKLRKSSGHRGYDEAVERAILKSSPLPRAEPAELFRRDLELKFRPRDL